MAFIFLSFFKFDHKKNISKLNQANFVKFHYNS